MIKNKQIFNIFLIIQFICILNVFVYKPKAKAMTEKQYAKSIMKEIIKQNDPIVITTKNNNLENIFYKYYLSEVDKNVIKSIRKNKNKSNDYCFIKKERILSYVKKNKKLINKKNYIKNKVILKEIKAEYRFLTRKDIEQIKSEILKISRSRKLEIEKNKIYTKLRNKIAKIELNRYSDRIIHDSGIKQYDSDKTIINKISNYLISNYTYNYNYSNNKYASIRNKYGKISNEYILYKMETIYNQKSGICCDFSELFKNIMDRVNIPCNVIVGGTSPRIINHVWNTVYIDNQWKSIDITWDICRKSIYYGLDMESKIFDKNHYVYKIYK